jgi:hypothetical protein
MAATLTAAAAMPAPSPVTAYPTGYGEAATVGHQKAGYQKTV